MASVATAEEMKRLNERLQSTRERVRGNRKEAIRVLHSAGITTKRGKLTSHYQTPKHD